MTVEHRIRITMGVLIFFVLGTGLTLFWTSRLVEDGIKRTKSTSQAVQSSFMLSILMNEYLDHGTSRALTQWERHREALGKILDEMASEPTNLAMLSDLKNSFRAVNSLAPQVLRIGSSLDSRDELQDSRSKDMLKSLMGYTLGTTAQGCKRTEWSHSIRDVEQEEFRTEYNRGGLGFTGRYHLNQYLSDTEIRC